MEEGKEHTRAEGIGFHGAMCRSYTHHQHELDRPARPGPVELCRIAITHLFAGGEAPDAVRRKCDAGDGEDGVSCPVLGAGPPAACARVRRSGGRDAGGLGRGKERPQSGYLIFDGGCTDTVLMNGE